MNYFRLRKAIFVNEIKHWLKQIEHLFIVLIIFLGTALPALFFMALLAFGIILDNQSSPTQLFIIVWCMLLTQSLTILFCKPAILGSSYNMFLESQTPKRYIKYIADSIFALVCSPLLIILLFLLGSVHPMHWSNIPHGFLLCFLLGVVIFSCMFNNARVYLFLFLGLMSIPMMSVLMFSLTQGLVFLLALAFVINICAQFWRTPSLHINFRLPVSLQFWFSIYVGHLPFINQNRSFNNNPSSNKKQKTSYKSRSSDKPNALVTSIAISSLIILMGQYSAINLTEYKSVVYFISGQLLVLICTSLQLSINKLKNQYSLFFSAYIRSNSLLLGQFLFSCGLSILLLVVFGVLFAGAQVVVHLLSVFICIYIAHRYSAFFVVGWLGSCALTAFILY